MNSKISQTPAHEAHNPDLLSMLPVLTSRVIEVGCSSGALAREFKRLNPNAHYIGVEIEPSYAELAKRHCDGVMAMNIEDVDASFYAAHSDREAWVFGDTLEHLRDPWRVLRLIRAVIPASGCVIACIPNVQHWSLQARLSVGDFRYADEGLLDRTHLRWFSRQTMFEMFDATGFVIVEARARVFEDPRAEDFLYLIGEMAEAAGGDPRQAMEDAKALQFVLRAQPKM